LARFVDAIVDPSMFDVVRAAARRRPPIAAASRAARVERALRQGPEALEPAERLALLGDVDALDALYGGLRARRVHPGWMAPSGRGRATVHQMPRGGFRQPRTLATLVRPG
jgi:membrane glycosyltransferase